jgi:proline iminopeptidase
MISWDVVKVMNQMILTRKLWCSVSRRSKAIASSGHELLIFFYMSLYSPFHSYSIEKGVDDLEALIKSLGLRKFHLFGHSFGGSLGYEFLKRIAERRNEDVDAGDHVLSFIIAPTPTSVPLVEAEAQSLVATLLEQDDVEESTVGGRFEKEHICRMLERPQPLKDAYSHAGTVWRGTGAIANYVAMPPQSDSAAPLPPATVLRGEHDFVTKACLQDWKESIWKHKRIWEKELPGCTHHGLLENAFLFGNFVDSFCTEYDP